MKRLILLLALLPVLSCKQDSLGPLNGILIVYSDSLAEFIDAGGVDDLHLVVETVDPEEVFSFSFAETSQFQGTLKSRRIILLLLSPSEAHMIPGKLEQDSSGVYTGEDVWALGQQVVAVVVDPGSPVLSSVLPEYLENAYNEQMRNYLYESFVNTGMSSELRIDSLAELGFTIDVPKSFATAQWTPEDGFIQYQRQPDEESFLLLSIFVLQTETELTDSSAVLAREAMARNFFFDASADSVDRARISAEPITMNGLPGFELTGVWRNPEYLNAGSFTARVFDTGSEWYILDMEVYNPGRAKEPYMREGWIIMDTFRKE
jgi:hypothetical protein